MADPNVSKPGNAPGQFFVDEGCVCCSACITLAPEHFDDPDGEVVCVAQPQGDVELARCLDAMACCPVDAIGRLPPLSPRARVRSP